MAFNDTTKSTQPFKKLGFKAHTANQKEVFNEARTSFVQVPATTIFADAIPATSGAAVASGVAEFVVFDMVLDNTSNGKAYFAVYPDTHAQSGEYPENLIPPAFGQDFRAILKDNGTEVTPLDARDWLLDYSNGIVVSEDDLSLGTTGTLECFVYRGEYLSDRLGASGLQGDTGPAGPTGPTGPAGADGADGADAVVVSGTYISEDLSSQLDGASQTFSLSYSPRGSGYISLFWNGVRQRIGDTYDYYLDSAVNGSGVKTNFVPYADNDLVAEYLI